MLREQRSLITPAERCESAAAAARILANHPIFQTSQHIACYLTHGDEFDTTLIISLLWQAKKQCYLPITPKSKQDPLVFVKYQADDVLSKNHVGILEPQSDSLHLYPVEQLDLVILPLIGFNRQGYRLGTGGAYYDRTFSFLKKAAVKKPYLLGLGYEQQALASMPIEAWDVPMNAVLTESALHEFS